MTGNLLPERFFFPAARLGHRRDAERRDAARLTKALAEAGNYHATCAAEHLNW